MNIIDAAIGLACKAHAGQLDKAGQPYILHPLRLMLKFAGEPERIVAVLHDVVEDGGITLAELEQLGVPSSAVEAIDALTKRFGESYEDFILRLSVNGLARKIKIEDIKDNLDMSRLASLNEEDVQRIKKYHKALIFLSATPTI